MIKLKPLLLETPDKIVLSDGSELIWASRDAVVFGYYKNKMLIATHKFVNSNHWEEPKHYYFSEMYNLRDDSIVRNDLTFPGRLWYEHGIISFWNRFPERDELKTILSDIYEELQSIYNKNSDNKKTDPIHCGEIMDIMDNSNFGIDSDIWRIDVPRYYNMSQYTKSKLMLIKDYKNTKSTFKNVDHVNSPMIKHSKVPDGVGSKTKKYGNLTATQYHQMVSTSENVND